LLANYTPSYFDSATGGVPEVVRKGIGISYPIEKSNKERAAPGPQKKGRYTDGEV